MEAHHKIIAGLIAACLIASASAVPAISQEPRQQSDLTAESTFGLGYAIPSPYYYPSYPYYGLGYGYGYGYGYPRYYSGYGYPYSYY